ncbi:MAG: glycoside hydrolase family 36 N-terminal domain-containing protein, partial [Terrimicrobiaceae bacterium]
MQTQTLNPVRPPAPPAKPHDGTPAQKAVEKSLIEYDQGQGAFFLHSAGVTYAAAISQYGFLTHAYWGPSLAPQNLNLPIPSRGRAFSPNPIPGDADFSLDTTPLEYPVYGRSDFRSPALEIVHSSVGARTLDLRYSHHRIVGGKQCLENLPSVHTDSLAEAATLLVTLRDESIKIAVELSYTVFAEHPVIVRSARIINEGEETFALRRALSCSIDFPPEFSN